MCSISDEAFALLLIENSYDRWMDIFKTHGGNAGRRAPGAYSEKQWVSDVPPKYTHGGIIYKEAAVRERAAKDVKGWSNEGIRRYNALFHEVKKDRKEHPTFITNLLNSIRQKKRKEMCKKRKRDDVTPACNEFFQKLGLEEGKLSTGKNDESDSEVDSDFSNKV